MSPNRAITVSIARYEPMEVNIVDECRYPDPGMITGTIPSPNNSPQGGTKLWRTKPRFIPYVRLRSELLVI